MEESVRIWLKGVIHKLKRKGPDRYEEGKPKAESDKPKHALSLTTIIRLYNDQAENLVNQ